MRFLILLFKTQSVEKIKQMDICRGCSQSSRKKQIQRGTKSQLCIFYKAQWQTHKVDHHNIPVRLLLSLSDQTVFTAVVIQQKKKVVQNLSWVMFNPCG